MRIKLSTFRHCKTIKFKSFSAKSSQKAWSWAISLNLAEVSTGLKAYQIGKGIPKQTEDVKRDRKFHSFQKLSFEYLPYLEGRNVARYNLSWSGEFLRYGEFLAEPRRSVPFIDERILVRQIPSKPPYCINATFTNQEFLHDINSMVIFKNRKDYDIKLILGIINSKLISYWFFEKYGKLQRKIFPQFKVRELRSFPIHAEINETSKIEIGRLVDKMLVLNDQLQQASVKGSYTREKLIQELSITDTEIDQLVYQLYEITENEKRAIEKISSKL